jgi:hypothetical protein
VDPRSAIHPRASGCEVGALIAATILVVAAWAQAKVNGVSWRWQFKGAEYMLFWASVTLLVVFL